MEKKRIVILGGGFGGVYTAMRLEKLLKKLPDWELVLINRENYFVYQPMLPEVVGGSLGVFDTVSSLRKLLPKTKLFIREIDQIDLQNKKIILAPQFSHKPYELTYDHLVFTLGTNLPNSFFTMPKMLRTNRSQTLVAVQAAPLYVF